MDITFTPADDRFAILTEALADQGRVEFQITRQVSGPYCSVRGLGVDASGYRTIEEAFDAWLDARELSRELSEASA